MTNSNRLSRPEEWLGKPANKLILKEVKVESVLAIEDTGEASHV